MRSMAPSHMRTSTSRQSMRCAAASTPMPKQFKTIKPVGDRVFVKIDKADIKSIGGVLLPSASRTNSTAGTVVSLGDVTMLKSGDRVVYSKFAGTDISVGDENHVLLKEDDVIGVLPKGEKISSLRPLSDRVLIKGAKAETKTSGGVLLSNDAVEKPTFGTIVAVGMGKKKEDSDEIVQPNVTVGQTVMYSKYSGTEFEEDLEEYIVVREGEILAVLS
mmetsp:Transcript_21768/g.37124  ORF Transcript_21768/g.37124 Transcript_21768/m.37124 type:complete len:218 (+) Transcript_21768:44-697(+)|eukprot:CAMPEP_0119101356 /NCGR_PEP_ID=MMETSP1180-20130426/432_1 /TAXON_ID=3052 ORGANISM="Chlamydomonas cf sp, Strain CCMP681" /NCGR_SAMPLE_ID=MMETSP1180 /ASSEMBLY_ACC=CAM_ASM_000741 /LENGTH=217 /DNA_ID=CAMNT_0007085469 /DNA_START=45 /DNA_END=698 /DNA_ORIENTATION=+